MVWQPRESGLHGPQHWGGARLQRGRPPCHAGLQLLLAPASKNLLVDFACMHTTCSYLCCSSVSSNVNS